MKFEDITLILLFALLVGFAISIMAVAFHLQDVEKELEILRAILEAKELI